MVHQNRLGENPLAELGATCLPRVVHDNVQTQLSTSCAGPLASTALTICAVWRRWQVFIYLFRDERTDLRALTMDVTGRNIPAVTSSTVWLFVEAINTHVLPPQWDTAYLRDAVHQARTTGFYHLGSEQMPPTR